MTIRGKILVGYLATVAVLAVAGLFGLWQLEQRFESAVGERTRDLAASLRDRIEDKVYHRAEQVREIANTTGKLIDTLAVSNRRFLELDDSERSREIARLDALWRERSSGSGLPEVIRVVEDEALSARLRKQLTFFREEVGFQVFGELFVTNRFGVNVAQSQITSDYRQDDEVWWQEGRRQPLWLSAVGFDESSGVFSIDFVARVEDRAGTFQGVLKAVFNIEEIYRILEAFEDSNSNTSARVALWDARGAKLYPEFVAPEDGTGRSAPAPSGTGDRIRVADGRLEAIVHSQADSRYPDLGWTLTVSYATAEVLAPVRRLRRLFLAIGIVALLVSTVLGFLIADSIAAPIRLSASAAESLAEGDLSLRFEARGSGEARQLLESMGTMLDKLRYTIGGLVATSKEVRHSADRLGTSSRRIVTSAKDQSQATEASAVLVRKMSDSIEEVAGSVDQMFRGFEVTTRSVDEMVVSIESIAANAGRVAGEVSASLETATEILRSVERVADRADDVGRTSQAGLEEARQGGAAVIETMQGMAELAATIDELVVFHERLGLSSQRIHQITALIEKVAAQTNLLAINAAIQASQAGSYGEGFAVVAREMQSLSDNTGASAKEIGIAVEEVRIDIEGASALIEIGAERARRGRTLAASAGEALERTVETSRTASEAMQSIAGDSTDQTRIAGEMASAFEKIGKMAIAVEEETGRHSKTSESIRQAVATLGAASQRVGSAIERHRRDGSEVSHAMEQIAETSQSNVETSVVLVEVTRVLEKQAETLSSLASFFRQPADNLY